MTEDNIDFRAENNSKLEFGLGMYHDVETLKDL